MKGTDSKPTIKARTDKGTLSDTKVK